MSELVKFSSNYFHERKIHSVKSSTELCTCTGIRNVLPWRTYSGVTLDGLYGRAGNRNTVVIGHNEIPISLYTYHLSLLYSYKKKDIFPFF